MKMVTAVVALVLGVWCAVVRGQTEITYQGELRSGGAPVTGVYDMRFRLRSAPVDEEFVLWTRCLNNVPVTDGRFTVTVDLGPSWAGSESRYIEIAVRQDTGTACGSSTGYVLLDPPQRVWNTPRANYARRAGALSAADGDPFYAVYADDAGLVGIGTSTPAAQLHVKGEGAVLNLEGTAASFLQFYPIGAAAGRRGYFGFATSGSNVLSLRNVYADGHVQVQGGAGTLIESATPVAGYRVAIGANTAVTGAVRATGFAFDAPQVRYITIDQSAFEPVGSPPRTSGFRRTTVYLETVPTTSFTEQEFVAPVALPHGATLLGVGMTYVDNVPDPTSGVYNMVVHLERYSLDTGALVTPTYSTVSPPVESTAVRRNNANTGTPSYVIDNDAQKLSLRATMWSSSTGWQRLYGVTIAYSVTNPAP